MPARAMPANAPPASGRRCSPSTCRRPSIPPSRKPSTRTWLAGRVSSGTRYRRERVDHERPHVRGDAGGGGRLARAPRAHHAGSARAAHLCALSGAAAARGAVVARRSGIGVHVRVSDRAEARAGGAAHRAVYRSDLIVRQDARYLALEDTFGGRAGWTVAHSQSGFNAFRHHLLAYRTPQRPTLYAEMVGNLATARNVLDAVREGRIDVGPLDAYWHMLIARHAPQLTAGIRVLTSTPVTPMPAFVAAAAAPADMVARLRAAFTRAARRPWFGPLADLLLLEGFAEASEGAFAPLLQWDAQAQAAGFGLPA